MPSLFRYLCNANAVHENPVSGVKRPGMENANEGRTPALSDAPARQLLAAVCSLAAWASATSSRLYAIRTVCGR